MVRDLSTDDSKDVQHGMEQLSQASAGGQSTDDSTDLEHSKKQLFQTYKSKYTAQICSTAYSSNPKPWAIDLSTDDSMDVQHSIEQLSQALGPQL